LPSRGDILLYAISARRQVTWSWFSEVLEQIFVPTEQVGTEVKQVRSAVAGLGSLLGHWDIIADDQSTCIYIAPPTLALLPRPGLPSAVLCGSRSPDTIEAVKRAGRATGVAVCATAQDRVHPYAPARIEISADSHGQMDRFAAALTVGYQHEPAASALAVACGSVSDYVESLPWCTDADLNWPRRDFDPDRLCFVRRASGTSRDGLVLSSYEHPSGWTRQERLWRGNQSALAERDWGRFATLAERSIGVFSYDHSAGTVTGPAQVPLPSIPARALGLCSGQPPIHRRGDGLGLHVFTSVPEAVATTLARKLGQSFALLPTSEGKGGID